MKPKFQRVLSLFEACAKAQDFASMFETLRSAWTNCPEVQWKRWLIESFPEVHEQYQKNYAKLEPMFPNYSYDDLQWNAMRSCAADSVFGLLEAAVEDFPESQLQEFEGKQEQHPEDGDYVLAPSGTLGALTSVSTYGDCGTYIGEYATEVGAEDAIRKHAEGGFFPNVWRLSDHGNYHLYTNFRYSVE